MSATSPRPPGLRVSQRPSTACRECALRKVRCDKKIPCGRCLKKSLRCTHEVVRISKALSRHREELQFLRRLQDVAQASGGQAVVDEIKSRIQLLDHGHMDAEVTQVVGRVDTAGTTDVTDTATTETAHLPNSANSITAITTTNTASVTTTGSPPSTDSPAEVVTAFEFLTWGRRTQACFPHRRCHCYQHRRYAELVSINSDAAWANRLAIRVFPPPSPAPPLLSALPALPAALPPLMHTTVDPAILLPPPLAAAVVQFHMDHLHWHHNAFHGPTFLARCHQFWATGTVDHPLWLALYLAVSSVSLWALLNADRHRAALGLDALLLHQDAGTPNPLNTSTGTGTNTGLIERQFQAMVDVLYGENFLESLSLYSVQAILISTRIAHALDRSELNATLVGAAVRIAHCLGLHKIPAPATDVGDDSTEPGSVGWHERIELETGKRVWAQLRIQDHFQIPFTDTYIIHLQQFSTPLPSNCSDADMIPRPPNIATNSSYTRMLAHTSSIMPQLLDGLGPLSARRPPADIYAHIIACDRAMRSNISQIPGFLLRETATPPATLPWIPLARLTLAISAAEKIIMIHRPVLFAAFQTPADSSPFRHTRHTCVAAATTILREHEHVVQLGAVPVWTHSAFCITGAVVLWLELLHRPDHTDDRAHTYRHLLARAADRLRSRRGDALARRGALLIDTLLAAEEDLVVRLMRTALRPRSRSTATPASDEDPQRAIIHEMMASHEILARFLAHEYPSPATAAPLDDVVVPSIATVTMADPLSMLVSPDPELGSVVPPPVDLGLVQDFDIWFNEVFAPEHDSAML